MLDKMAAMMSSMSESTLVLEVSIVKPSIDIFVL